MKSVNGTILRLCGTSERDLFHFFDQADIDAINTAIATSRPLLVRGEPGIGKSQLARAAAIDLRRAYLTLVVNSHTEYSDLLWSVDTLNRLATAQLLGALREITLSPREVIKQELSLDRYVNPGPLWWAFNWESATAQAEKANGNAPNIIDGCDAGNGSVVLIDEIDKAEARVPNGLLEALGDGSFTPPGSRRPVVISGQPPLVIITTNEDRPLSDAFIRRCVVLHKIYPADEGQMIKYLVERGKTHYESSAASDVLVKAAKMVIEDRRDAERSRRFPLPGQAEYLDLLRAVLKWYPSDVDAQMTSLDQVRPFVLNKTS